MPPYVAAHACSTCPYRDTCHEPRQRIQDGRYEAGRHYQCPFYQSIRESHAARAPRRRWWRSLFRGGQVAG